jgi:opacity protein-like surface antigen
MKRLLRNLVLPVLLGAFAARAMAADALQNVEKQPINITAISMFLVFVVTTLGITYWAASRPNRWMISTTPAVASPGFRMAWRWRVTTCRLRRCWASPA